MVSNIISLTTKAHAIAFLPFSPIPSPTYKLDHCKTTKEGLALLFSIPRCVTVPITIMVAEEKTSIAMLLRVTHS